MGVKVRNISPYGALEVRALGSVIGAGEVVDLPARIAGRPPTITTAPDGTQTTDPGEGLLAQPDNWEPVTTTTAAPAAGKGQ